VNQRIQVSSSPKAGAVEVNGREQCQETPCEVTVKKMLIWVGTFKTESGYECRATYENVVVFPQNNSSDLFSQVEVVNPCEDKQSIQFDLKKPDRVRPRGVFKRKDLLKNYVSVGGIDFMWHDREANSPAQRYSSVSIAYGTQVYLGEMILVLGELYGAKRNPLDTVQFELGAKAYIHNAHSTIFYLSPGVSYKKTENEFAVDVVSPYFGIGLLLNQKILTDFGRMFMLGSMYYRSEVEYEYQVGELNYDFYVEYGINFQSQMQKWDTTSLSYGARWYF
jgi:hypothetical protein